MGRTIAILTDFGLKDNYVGVMKGVIRRICPYSDIIDISNSVPSGDIRSAAFLLESAYRFFPQNTVFLCVVDPGVGSKRQTVALEADGQYFVAPDNGLLTAILTNCTSAKAVNLTNTKFHLSQKSSTFHGRDIFAPVSAYISMKTEIEELGEIINVNNLIKLENYTAIKQDDSIIGDIVHIDNFGNLITNISDDIVKKKAIKTLVAEYEIYGLSQTFSDVKQGELCVYIGSSSYVEIAVNCGRADELINSNSKVMIKWKS